MDKKAQLDTKKHGGGYDDVSVSEEKPLKEGKQGNASKD